MKIDKDLLYRFEDGLNPQRIEQSRVPASILGYGEISTIFKIEGDNRTAFKRMPLFSNRQSAEDYVLLYREYSHRLKEAGLNLPDHDAVIVSIPRRPVVVYIAQERLPSDRFGHHLIQTGDRRLCMQLIEQVAMEVSKVWRYNAVSAPGVALALDGQISNWVCMEGGGVSTMVYIDTSTPFLRKDGVEQLDPEPLLKSAPFFLRWILKWLFLDDVMNRYYDSRQVFIDIAANLYKEQRKDLIHGAIEIFNRYLTAGEKPLAVAEVEKYYREDKLIWTLFLAFRRMDCRLTTKLLRKRYEFILPGKIAR
ncbi:MAG: hypothetical protein JRI64_01235 [Deltaproteobacteria bacterium]|nr:hypothetical protein [Deltaproteobacteria bacterium]